MRLKFPLLALSIMSLSFISVAEEYETHDAHVHGVAQLQIVAENNQLEMHFESPALNIVGFEHEIRNQEEADKLKDAIGLLMKTDELFLLTEGGCSFIGIEVENPFEKEDDHHDEHHDTLEHREFEMEYKATCRNLDKLTRIHLPLLDTFGRIESLDVQYIFQGKQGSVVLTQAKPFLDLQ